MSEYKIKFIHPDPPKPWNNPKGGVVYYLTVDVEEHDKPLSVGKKSPDALKVGDTIYGDIIPTDYLEDKFKPSPPPEGKAEKSDWKPKDERQITKNMVWKNLLGHFDVQSMQPDTEQWSMFWALVELHTDLLLPKADKPVVEPPKAPETTPEAKGNPALRKGLEKSGHSFGVADSEPLPEEPPPGLDPEGYDAVE